MRALDPLHDEYVFTVSDRASGKAAVFDLVDRLGAAMRRKLGVASGGPGGANASVASITTTSPKAWELLFRARQAFDQGRVKEAGNLAKAALAEDPEFALAHYLAAESAAAVVNGWFDPGSVDEARSCWARSPTARTGSPRRSASRSRPCVPRWTAPGSRPSGSATRSPRPIPSTRRPSSTPGTSGSTARGGRGDSLLPAGPPARSRLRLRNRAPRGSHREFREGARAPGLDPKQAAVATEQGQVRQLANALLSADHEGEAVALFRKLQQANGGLWPPDRYAQYLAFNGRADELEDVIRQSSRLACGHAGGTAEDEESA